MALKGFGFVFFQSDSEGVSQTSSQEQDKEGDGKLGQQCVGTCVKRACTLSLPSSPGRPLAAVTFLPGLLSYTQTVRLLTWSTSLLSEF